MLGDPIYNPDTMYPVDLIGTLDTDTVVAERAYRERTGYTGPINWTFKRPDMSDQEAFELLYLGTPAERRKTAALKKRIGKIKDRKQRRAEAEAENKKQREERSLAQAAATA